MIFGAVSEHAAKTNLEEANRLWASGQKPEAIAKYRGLIDDGVGFLEKSDRPTVFQRVIEFEADQDNPSLAKDLIYKARTNGVTLSFNSQKAKQVVAEVEDEARKRVASETDDKDNKKPSNPFAAARQIKPDMHVATVRRLLGKPDLIYAKDTIYGFAYEGGKIVVGFNSHTHLCVGLVIDGDIIFALQ
jgi:hypothetical protein